MKSPVFARVRKDAVAAILIAAGSTALVACSSSDTNYRPAPNYTQPSAQTPAQNSYSRPATTYAPPPTYTAPAQPAYVPPAAPQHACGKGKCG